MKQQVDIPFRVRVIFSVLLGSSHLQNHPTNKPQPLEFLQFSDLLSSIEVEHESRG